MNAQVLLAMLSVMTVGACQKEEATQPQPAVPVVQKAYDFCIRRSVLTEMSDAQADDVLARATRMMRSQTSPACQAVSAGRRGSVELIDPDKEVDIVSEADFNRVMSDHCMNVVNKITWCGADIAYLSGGALGCAPILGKGAVVVRSYQGLSDRYNSGVEPITWMHEFGHNQGLQHVDDAHDVMTAALALSSDKISPNECTVYDGIRRVQGKPQVGAAGLAEPPSAPAAGAQALPLNAFVNRSYPMGFPVEAAKRYAGQEAQALALLDDPAYAKHQSSIVAVLGVIGSPAAIPRLTRMLLDLVPTSSDDAHIDTLLAVPIAIGVIANRYHLPPRDFDILREASKPQYWQQRVVVAGRATIGRDGLTPAQIDNLKVNSLVRELSSQALKGYALTGSDGIDLTLKANSSRIAAAAIPAEEKADQVARFNDALSLQKKSRQVGALAVVR